ncbi:MAG: type III restriction protein res subunit [Candidatus Berkelbacteria bacterium Gr01-1014_85]|uniref:Type III restriction protein res subunit n=1 Tax=Candidatus Berkelbacteria bacterium Gr01-1014_85 TaxID=2017150 RepID=A0A554JDL9_9BACT|nr:MAG: type III restriction protein res subunit [Candidatus Berkelbacteria bacterium Gr01-1014_85]
MANETFSRVIIDRKLREAGWDIEDSNQVIFEDHGIAGRSDYILKDKQGRPLALIEAKGPDIDPYNAKQQALNYAETQYKGKINHIYLANDHLIYFWDFTTGGDAIPVPHFFSQNDLSRKQQVKTLAHTEPLNQKMVEKDYFHDVDSDIMLRPYQMEAWHAIAGDYDNGKRGFLLEMATGTGKTVLASLIISKFLRTHQAQTVLFVVDRIELARQTKGTFEHLLGHLSAVGTYWGDSKKNLVGANVVIATIQSLIAHGQDVFTPGYFDLVIHDEAHRSIYSPEARGIMDYFVGATKIGLTATPKDFLKNLDMGRLGLDDPRAAELRVQRDTYRYFGCENGQATFRYTLQDGVKEGFLVPPKLHKMTSALTQQALSPEGLVGEADYENESYSVKDLEKKVFVPERNRLMMQEFLEYAEKSPDGNIGKTIIFAVNQTHATSLEKILNQLKPEFGGRFAITITSRVQGAHDLARDFKKLDNNLPRAAVSVDMLTTGYDAPEVQNIVLARPVFEPTLYQQIKGRGTRLCKEIDKKQFVVFDFCGVCEYFEEQYDWKAPQKITKPTDETTPPTPKGPYGPSPTGEGEPPEPPAPKTETSTISRLDVVGSRDQIIYGPDGDKVDREMYQDEWSRQVKTFVDAHPEAIEMAQDDTKTEELIDLLNTELLNRPDFYFNEGNLIQSHRVIASVRDFFLSAIGKGSLPKRNEQLGEWRNGMLDKYGQASSGGSQKRYLMTRLMVDEIMKNDELRIGLQQKPSLNFLLHEPFNLDFRPEEWLYTYGKDTLFEMVHDVKNSQLLKV